jgi:hypothetical protein
MNPVHVHLMVNHVPVLGAFMACALLGFALLRDHEPYKKLAYVILAIVGLSAPIVAFSGEKAEERIETLAAIPDPAIHAHEEAGEAVEIASGVLGFLAFLQLCSYLFPNMARARGRTAVLLLLGAAASFAWAAYTANLGGKIRHAEELRMEGGGPPAVKD